MRKLHAPGLDAVERRLVARAGVAAPAGHRDRVLAAVRDMLDQRPGQPARAGSGIDAGGAAALLGIALSALLAVVAPWFVVARAVPLPTEPRVVAQARAAGVDLPLEFVATTTHRSPPAVSRMREPPSARLHEAWHLRNLLTGEL